MPLFKILLNWKEIRFICLTSAFRLIKFSVQTHSSIRLSYPDLFSLFNVEKEKKKTFPVPNRRHNERFNEIVNAFFLLIETNFNPFGYLFKMKLSSSSYQSGIGQWPLLILLKVLILYYLLPFSKYFNIYPFYFEVFV